MKVSVLQQFIGYIQHSPLHITPKNCSKHKKTAKTANYLILLNFKCMILPEFTSKPVIFFLLSRVITR